MPTLQRIGETRLRYQIADLVVDLVHGYWTVFLLAQSGTFTMGGVTVFAPLRRNHPNYGLAVGMVALVALAAWGLQRQHSLVYGAARVVSGLFFAYLAWLCLMARPISTGVVYSAIGLGALLLAGSATVRYLAESDRYAAARGEA